MSLNVIMPCAGSGTRLGLPYPKEIHLVARDTALMDFSLSLCEDARALVGSVSIVLTPEKADIVRYLAKWRDRFNFRFTFFDPQYHEWAGSVRSAAPLFGERNVVLLPDSVLHQAPDNPVLAAIDRGLDSHDVMFGHVAETDPARLCRLGALRVEDGRVTAFCDKPDRDHARFNAFWGTFAFRRAAAETLLDFMTRSIRREPVDLADLGLSVGTVPLAGYEDLGTWPSLHNIGRFFGPNPERNATLGDLHEDANARASA